MGLKLIGEVALDGSGFERGLNSMASSVKGFIAGAFGLYSVESMIRKTVDTAKELVNTSQRLGVGVEQLQVLKQAAKDSGKELGDVANMFAKIDQAREKALSGSPEGIKLLARFGQLGISQADLQNPNMTASSLVMGPMHQKAAAMNQEDLGPILKAFGKGLEGLIPMLKTDFDELQKKMQRFGLLMDTETAAGLKSFTDGLDMLTNLIAAQLGPTLLRFMETLEGGVSNFLGWMDKRFRGEPPGEEPAKKGSWASRAWEFNGKAGSAIVGGVTGLFGLWDELIGDTEKADERLMAADAWFKQAGLGGGWLNEAADAMVADKNAGKASLKAAWDALVIKRKEDLAALIETLKHPKVPTFDVPSQAEEKKPHQFHEKGDALLRVGNFLGSSRSALEDIGQKQVQLLQQIANNTKSQGAGDTGPGDDDFPTL